MTMTLVRMALRCLSVGAGLLLGTACSTMGPLEAPGTSRDLHGPPNVEEYIELLQSEGRVRELQPKRVVEVLKLEAGASVADLGCGPGVFSLPLARAVPSGVVYAVDVDPAQLDALREALLELDVRNVVPVLASYTDPHLPPRRIDLCFVSDTYHHIDGRVEYFTRLQEDMQPNGRLVILDYNDGELPVGPPPSKKVSHAVRHQELALAGWRLAETFNFHAWHELEVWRRATAPID